jgi:hypothetical protein
MLPAVMRGLARHAEEHDHQEYEEEREPALMHSPRRQES